jgi:YD repeat-containing protein
VYLPWLREQRAHAQGAASDKAAKPAGVAANASVTSLVPEGQGDVPWHRYTRFAITDALTAKIDYSTGNLMLTATDFDIAGVGQRLMLARTYNSLDAPWGKVSQRWWQQYERYLSLSSGEAVFYDASGGTVRFTKNSDGSFATPKGYSEDLKKNADGTYTLTKWKSGSKETYDQYGTLTKVTDRNNGTITVTQHDESGEHKGFKLTETRSGRWIDLLKTDASQWQAKDNTGRTAVFNLDGAGNLATTTDTEGKTVTFRYDTSGRVDKITTAEGRVTVFTYDDANRDTSMLRGTGFNSDGHTGPTWTYAYSAASPTAAGTTTATDPELHATKYTHDGDGQVTEVEDALKHKRSTKFDANHNIDTATDAMGSGTTPGNVTDYGFDGRNNLESAVAPTGGKTVNTWQTVAGGDVPKDSTNADGEKTAFTYDTAGNTKTVAQTGTGGGSVSYDYNPATPTCGGFQGQRCAQKTKMTSSKTVQTDFHYDAKGNLEWAQAPAPLGKVPRGQPQDVHGTVRFHRPERTHPPRGHLLPQRSLRPVREVDRRCGHGLQPRARGHVELHDDRGQELLLPHRRHRQRDRSGGRGRQQGRQLRLQPARSAHPGPLDGTGRPALPLRRQLPGPHRPLPPEGPLLRPQHRPLHPARPLGPGTEPLPLRGGRPRQQDRSVRARLPRRRVRLPRRHERHLGSRPGMRRGNRGRGRDGNHHDSQHLRTLGHRRCGPCELRRRRIHRLQQRGNHQLRLIDPTSFARPRSAVEPGRSLRRRSGAPER